MYYKENKSTIETIIHAPVINRNLVRNLPLMVLWRKVCIQRIAPTRPPSPVYRRRFFSEILRFWAVALYLSIHRTTKVIRLIRSKYRISNCVRVIGV